VLDHLLDRPDTDPDRVAVIGVSQGGYWVPRPLAFEHRLAAAAVDPGIVDVLGSWLNPLPERLREQLRAGERDASDRQLQLASLLSPRTAATLRFRGAPYRRWQDSLFDLYTTVAAYRLDGEASNITTPLLITDPDDEQFWPSQSKQLYDRLRTTKRLVQFPRETGSNRHCEPLACATRDACIFDWLRYLAPETTRANNAAAKTVAT
jgi:hypothetical protein